MARSCEGLVALVTGASQEGTGRAVAIRLAAEGAKVAINARSSEGLRETLARIEKVGGTGLVLQADLGEPDGGRDSLVERTEAALGPVDILVNNAVAYAFKPFDQWTLPELEVHQQVNVWAPLLLMQQVVRGMRGRRRGWILNLTSFSGELPPGPPFATKAKDGSSIYGATKAALNRLTVAVAGETEGEGIAVNALTPQCAILATTALASGRVSGTHLYEPLETMAEAALALCTSDPAELTGRIAYSLQLLLELRRPVFDLRGEQLVDGWQPADLPAAIRLQEDYHTANGWPNAFDFHRPHTPLPDATIA